MAEGDVYIVKYSGTSGSTSLNAEYAYNGKTWIELGTIIDLSSYSTKEELNEKANVSHAHSFDDIGETDDKKIMTK